MSFAFHIFWEQGMAPDIYLVCRFLWFSMHDPYLQERKELCSSVLEKYLVEFR